MMKEQVRAIALRFANEGWGTQPDWRTVWDDIVASDVVHHFNSDPNTIVGLEENKAFNASLFAGFPNIDHSMGDLLIDGDRAVYRTTLQGTHTGEFLGIPPTNKSVILNDFTLVKVQGEKIVEWWYDCNFLALMRQLGLSE